MADEETCSTSLYNSDILYIADKQEVLKDTCVEYVRLSFIDESCEYIEKVVRKYQKREKEIGYLTYGYFLGKKKYWG